MNAQKTNRREFLGLTGASLVGLAMAAGALSLPEALAAPLAAAGRKPPIEEWLLSTGQASLSPGIYNQASQMINGLHTRGKSKTSKGRSGK
jgi:hypothetical protein